MARTVNDIFDSLVQAKESDANLGVLNSSSSVSIWRLILYVVAVGSAVLEQMFDLFQSEINTAIDSKPNQTDLWLQSQALLFQDGDNIGFDKFYKPIYLVVDEIKRIITISSARTISYGVCQLKVAKGEKGNYSPLSTAELVRFTDYVKDIKPLGTRIEVISQESDKLKGMFSVYYDPSINPADLQANVRAAIDEFLTLLPFNGLFYISRLEDAVQAVEGVVDIVIEGLGARTHLGVYEPVERRYLPFSGYLSIEDSESTFIYTAE